MTDGSSTWLQLRGRDALPLLQRISTQAILDLGPGSARPTLFCDFRGRLLHRVVVAIAGDESIWLLRHDAPGAPLAQFLDRHVFRDDVRIDDRSGEMVVALVEGGLDLSQRFDAGFGLSLAFSPEDLPPHDPAELERIRLRKGFPLHGHEIVEEFNPFEVNLGGDMHLDKGCFTGQETLQRLVTYGSVRRRLVLLEGPGPPPLPKSSVTVNGAIVGVVTSAGVAERANEWLGLAVVRRESANPSDLEAYRVGENGLVSRLTAFPEVDPVGRPRSARPA